MTYAYPPHAVNVPFTCSHIKVSRSSLEPNYQHDSFTLYEGFFKNILKFFNCNWIQFFFKEMFVMLLYYNVRTWIVFRRAEFRCSKSLFSMLLFKNYKYNRYSWIKRVIHVRMWIRIYLLQLNYLFGVGIQRKHTLHP